MSLADKARTHSKPVLHFEIWPNRFDAGRFRDPLNAIWIVGELLIDGCGRIQSEVRIGARASQREIA
jgi:hypothetical protein